MPARRLRAARSVWSLLSSSSSDSFRGPSITVHVDVMRKHLELATAFACATLVLSSNPAIAQRGITLKEAYQGAFKIGVSVGRGVVSGADSSGRRLVLEHFNSITAENAMKAGPINPRPGVYNWGPADSIVAFDEAHGMFIVGHTLVWHNQTPDWFFQDENGNPNTPEQQIERMRRHIEAVAGRYAGRVHAWDVVNEVIDNDGSYRQTSWVRAVGDGDELVKNAFRFA